MAGIGAVVMIAVAFAVFAMAFSFLITHGFAFTLPMIAVLRLFCVFRMVLLLRVMSLNLALIIVRGRFVGVIVVMARTLVSIVVPIMVMSS